VIAQVGSMESRVKIFGVTVAVVLCAALATDPGLAQEDAPTADRDVRANGGAGDGISTKGPATRAGSDASNKGAVGPEFTSGGGFDPVRPEGGPAGLQRRANPRTLIANAPKVGRGLPASNTDNGRPPMRPPMDGPAARNAIGVAMPGGQTAGHAVPGFTIQAGTGVTGVGAARGTIGGVNLLSPPAPPHAGPAPRAAGLNGTMMGHIASGPSSIGGPTKDRSGINGTSIRPKY
jgi:hypothetical protein